VQQILQNKICYCLMVILHTLQLKCQPQLIIYERTDLFPVSRRDLYVMLRAICQSAQFAKCVAQRRIRACAICKFLTITDPNANRNPNPKPNDDPDSNPKFPNPNSNLTLILIVAKSRSAFCILRRLTNRVQQLHCEIIF